MPYTVTLNKTDNNKLIRRISDAAFLLLAGLYVFVVDITKTTLRLDLPDNWERHLILAISAAAIFRLAVMCMQDKEQRGACLRYGVPATIICVDYFLIYNAQHSKTLVFLAVLTIGMIGLNYISALKVYAVAAAIVIFPAIALAWSGAIKNFVYVRDMTIRSSWGIKYPTDMMSLLFFLCLAVWITEKKKSNLWFLIPAAVMLAMSLAVADSRTGALCDLAFAMMVLLNYYLTRKEAAHLNRIVRFCACAAFPVFTVVMNGLMLAYSAGNSIAVKINSLMTGRLALASDALRDYGLSLFGHSLPQVGNGGSAFARPDYNFVDISYNLILLQFGIIALIIVNILWVMMTRKAFKIGDRRLALALALIAFNAVSEHHIMQINYDIFIVMPFAILAAKDDSVSEAATEPAWKWRRRKEYITKAGLIMAVAALSAAAILGLLPIVRTVISLTGTNENSDGRRLLYAIYVLGIAAAVAGMIALYRLCCSMIMRDTANRKVLAGVIAVVAAAGVVVIIGSNCIISSEAPKNVDLIDSEKKAIEVALESGRGKIYSNDMPELYEKAYGGFSSNLFNGEELARYNNVSVIMDKKTDSPCFFNTGFLYTPISDKHALFTNDMETIKALQDAGYHMTGYYPVTTEVDLAEEADRNGQILNDDGSITLNGEKDTLRKGPGDSLREGRYTVTYDLSLGNKIPLNENEMVCTLKVTYCKEDYTAAVVKLSRGQFDENGNYAAEVICDLPDALNTYIQVFPADNSIVTVNSLSYQKTPEGDIHSFYDENRIKVREEYFDLEGNPSKGAWGYFAKDIGYDDRGNINHEIYYDENNNKTLNSSGYSETKRAFNENNLIVREEYYGTDGKRIALPTGESAMAFAYDVYGRNTETFFFGVTDEPVLTGGETWGGFHKSAREFDEAGRVISECFFDTDGSPVTLKEGYSRREYEYDDNNNRIRELYYDQDGSKVLNSNGCAEIRREFDASNRKIRESYYGTDGEPIRLFSGQAMVEFMYDENGNEAQLSYFDAAGKPLLVGGETWGGYHKQVRVFDEAGRIMREDFYDIDGSPVTLKEGYSYREYEYDENASFIGYRYYDKNGNEVRLN